MPPEDSCTIVNLFAGKEGLFEAARFNYVCRVHGMRWETSAPYYGHRCPFGLLADRIAEIERKVSLPTAVEG